MDSTLGYRLKLVRGKATQQEFADRMGVDKNSIGRYERGERLPDADFLARIRQSQAVNIDWLISGEGEPSSREGAMRPACAVDEALLAAVIDGVTAVRRQMGMPSSGETTGRTAARILNQLLAAYENAAERRVGLKLALSQLRADLAAKKAEREKDKPGSGFNRG